MKPTITQTIAGMLFNWESAKVKVDVRRIYDHSDGKLTAWLTASTSAPGSDNHLHEELTNLTSARAKAELAKTLEARFPLDCWPEMVEQLAHSVILRHREGEPTKTLKAQPLTPISFLIDPILPEHQPTVIFGEGGKGKSWVADLLALVASVPWDDNPLGLGVGDPVNVLYLDWESDENDIAGRYNLFLSGHSLLDSGRFHYRHCSLPLVDDLDQIQSAIVKLDAKLVICDSLGLACGGDQMQQEAIRFFSALRRLRTTALILAHQSKDERKKASIFGSVFFYNMARSVWELKSTQEEDSNLLQIGLFHRKANRGRKSAPLGIALTITDTSVIVAPADLRDIQELSQSLAINQQILVTLRDGALSISDLAQTLDLRENIIRAHLAKLKKSQKILKLSNGSFGLITQQRIS